MRAFARTFKFFFIIFILLPAIGCTVLVEDRLEEAAIAPCAEHNLRLERELDLPACRTVVGERFLVHLKDFTPDTAAVVSFAPADAPQEVLATVEAGVGHSGTVSFQVPDLRAATGARIRVQIQGKNVLNAFSGHLEIRLMSTLAGIDLDGLVSLWFIGEDLKPLLQGRIPSLPGAAQNAELVLSPGGRTLAAGASAVADGPTPRYESGAVPRDLELLSTFARTVIGTLTGTGGIDSLAFLPDTSEGATRVVWSRRDAQTGRWKLVVGEFGEAAPGPAILVEDLPDFDLPPRLVQAFDGILVIPRDHVPAWLRDESGPMSPVFSLISPALTVSTVSCGDLFPGLDGSAVPLDARPLDHPQYGPIGLISCAARVLTADEPDFPVTARWVRWTPEGPERVDTWEVFAVNSPQIPLFWVLPPRPNLDSPALLVSLPSTDPERSSLLRWDPRAAAAVALDTSALAGGGLRALLLDDDTLLAYVPQTWRTTLDEDAPGLLTGTRAATSWELQTRNRDLQYALAWSEDLLILANTTQLIQSTLSDFTTGFPGTLIAATACGFAVLKPSHR